jgi:hypothetical protein
MRKRVLARAIDQANWALGQAGSPPIPTRLTPHGLRRTAASIWLAVGETGPRLWRRSVARTRR